MAIQICTLWFLRRLHPLGGQPRRLRRREDWSRDNFLSALSDGLFGVPQHWLSFAMNEHDEHDIDGNPLDENGIIAFDGGRTPCDSCGRSWPAGGPGSQHSNPLDTLGRMA
jgi:hypothetical protein